MTACIEIVTFRLARGTKEEDFLAAVEESKTAIKAFGGYLARYVSKDDKDAGLWTDMIVWKDHDTAIKAAQVVPKHPSFAKFGSMIDGPSVNMRHSNVTNTMHE